MKFSLLSLAAASSVFLSTGAVAQCPDDNRATALGSSMEGCFLCVPNDYMQQCRISCKCSGPPCTPEDHICNFTPDGCGTLSCGDDPSPPAPTPNPPTPAPAPTGDTPSSPTATPNNPACGAEIEVGCVLNDDESKDCNDFVPASASDCNTNVKYTYHAKQTYIPSNGVVFEHIHRSREGSYWEDEHGNPRKYYEEKNGGTLHNWEMTASEGEWVDFCKAGSVDTTLEFATDGGDLGTACVSTDKYTLTTEDRDLGATSQSAAEQIAPFEGDIASVETIPASDSDSSSASKAKVFLSLLVVSLGGMLVW